MRRATGSLVLFLALACQASTRARNDDSPVHHGIRLAGILAPGRLVPRAATGTHLPVGVAGLFAASRRSVRSGEDTQVNDPSLDHFYDFSATSTHDVFFCSVESEASLAVSGSRVVVTYNSSAGIEYVPDGARGYALKSLLMAGFSASADGGRTFRSGFLPPLEGGRETYADTAVDADRGGRFYAAYFSDRGAGESPGLAVAHSDDGGLTWGPPVLAAGEVRMDKLWIAVGPDPVFPGQDVVYVTWTSLERATELRIARSVDGGRRFSAPAPLFNPVQSPEEGLAASVQYSTPSVDARTGRLYVAFWQGTEARTSSVRLVASDDRGETFRLLKTGVPGAPRPDFIPAVDPGELADCGWEPIAVLHAGPDVRRPGAEYPRYEQSWWIGNQPFVAVDGDLVALSWASSTRTVPFDPGSGSRVFLIVSRDGGLTWSAPRVVHPEGPEDVHHVVPAVAIDASTHDVHVSYTVQHADETLDVELATFREADGYATFRTTRMTSQPSTIPPSNVSISDTRTANYDIIWPGYSLGHYMQLRAVGGIAYAAWNDARNMVTHPVNAYDPLSGRTHSQPDVYFRAVRP